MGVITGTIETEEELENGDVLLVSWVYAYNPGRPAPACSNPSSPLFGDPGDPEEFELDKPLIVCATNEDGYVIPINDMHREWLDELTSKSGSELEDRIYEAAKSSFDYEMGYSDKRRCCVY